MLLWERRRGEADARHVQKQPYRMRGGKVPVEKSEEVGDPVQVVPPALKVPMNLRRKTRMHKETLGKWLLDPLCPRGDLARCGCPTPRRRTQ